MTDVVIIDAVRTPIGRAYKGSLREVRADDLAAVPLRALLERNPQVAPDGVDELFMGAAYGHGEHAYNVGRNAALLAGLPVSVPACTVNRFCASSLQALRMAAHTIASGEADVCVAAGAEAVSRSGQGSGLTPNPLLDGSPGSVCDVYIAMGLTAENVAEREGVTREEQDAWALMSQTRAVAAQREGHFEREICPVETPAGPIDTDDGPRPGTTAEKLSALEPAFKPGGTVTAGNSCPLNDGAAAVLVTSHARARELGLKPRARIVASAVAALEPEYMGLGPIPAVRLVLERAGMTNADVDVVELNEAFAAQVVPCLREWKVDPERLNPFGGAIALGHPFGMTGARIMTTLLNDLETLDRTIGLETMCVAGGMGQAMIVERL